MIKSVFLLGIVRSGTSFLGKTLTSNNSRVYITHESDIIWILYNLYTLSTPLNEIQKYKWDSPQAMGWTIKFCREYLEQYKNYTPKKLYDICQTHLMQNGTHWQRETRKETIYLGDKKPTQQSDPEIFKWTEKVFKPKPKYIHLIRHPNDFLHSTLHFGKTAHLWGNDEETILKFWIKNQQNVLNIKKEIPHRVFTIKYENICENPKENLKKIYDFLKVELDCSYKDFNPKNVHRPAIHDKKIEFKYPKGFLDLMKTFKYKTRE